jgi:hypothetical protein
VNLRRLPIALALGVPASLIGHGLLFGGGHQIGGPLHGAIVSLAFAAVSSFAIFFAALAWRGCRAADGSVLATRLLRCLPGSWSIFSCAAFFFAACESIEPAHGARGIPVTLAVLLLASWLIRKLAHELVRAIADVTVAIAQPESASREPRWRIHAAEQPHATRALAPRRHFVRPPPPTTVATLRA